MGTTTNWAGCSNEITNTCLSGLSDDEFTLSGTDYYIYFLSVSSGALSVRFTSSVGFTPLNVGTSLNAYKFCVGSSEFAFSSITPTTSGSTFTWSNAGLSWSAGDTVSVSIASSCTPPPTVSLSATPATVAEGSPVTVRATLSAALASNVSIPVTVTPGTAEPGDIGTLSSITINSGQTSGTGTITTAQDTDTDNETFTVALGALPSGVTAGSPASVTVTIRDDDAPATTPTTTPPASGASRPPADPGISADAVLDALAVTAGDGAPVSFAPALSPRPDAPGAHRAVVPFEVDHITVAPTARHARHRAITVNGARVPSGRAGDPIALDPGIPEVITVTVTAEDDKTMKTYTLTVVRAKAAGAPTGVRVAPDLVRPAATDDPATPETDERLAQYRISLPWQPPGAVTVTPRSSAPAIASVSGPLRFTPANWDTPQPVTVTGRANGRAGIAHRLAGGGYDGVVVPEVTVIVGDGGTDPRKQVKPCAACDGRAADEGNATEPGAPADTNDPAGPAGAGTGDNARADAAPPRAPAGALAARARGHLAGARQVLRQRLDADADAQSHLTLGGQTLTLAQLLSPDWGAAFDSGGDRPPAGAGLSWHRATGACASWTTASCAGSDTPGHAPPHADRPAGAWESLLYGIASGLGQGAAGALLQGSGFTLALGAGDGPQGRRWTLWGRADTQALSGGPAGWAGRDTALQSGYLGLDTRLNERWLAGLAVSRSRGPGHAGAGLTGDGHQSVPHAQRHRAPATLTTVHPYLAWAGDTASLSIQAGLGRGRDGYLPPGAAPGMAAALTPDAVPLRLSMALADADHQLAARGGATLRLRVDAAWAQLTRGTGVHARTESVRRLRAGAEAAWTGPLPGGWTLAPHIAAHGRHDAGHGPTGRGLELSGGLRATRGPVRLTVAGRRFTTRAAGAHREQGLRTTLDLGRPGTAGWSLSLAAGWGDAATGGTALWQERLHYRHAAARNNPRTLNARSEVGLRLPGGRLLSGFADLGHAHHGRHVLLGLRLGGGAAPATADRLTPAPPGAHPLTEETRHGNE